MFLIVLKLHENFGGVAPSKIYTRVGFEDKPLLKDRDVSIPSVTPPLRRAAFMNKEQDAAAVQIEDGPQARPKRRRPQWLAGPDWTM